MQDVASSLQNGRRYLHVRVLGGSGFTDKMNTGSPRSNYVLHVHFGSQRFVSRAILSCVDPALSESFMVELPSASELAGKVSVYFTRGRETVGASHAALRRAQRDRKGREGKMKGMLPCSSFAHA